MFLQPQIGQFTFTSCPTPGKTMAETLAGVPDLKAGQDVILPLEKPIKETGHIQILYGNMAPEGSVAKITGESLNISSSSCGAIQEV